MYETKKEGLPAHAAAAATHVSACGMRPGLPSSPSTVYVFPALVIPYAKSSAFCEANTSSTSGRMVDSYASAWPAEGLNTRVNPKSFACTRTDY